MGKVQTQLRLKCCTCPIFLTACQHPSLITQAWNLTGDHYAKEGDKPWIAEMWVGLMAACWPEPAGWRAAAAAAAATAIAATATAAAGPRGTAQAGAACWQA